MPAHVLVVAEVVDLAIAMEVVNVTKSVKNLAETGVISLDNDLQVDQTIQMQAVASAAAAAVVLITTAIVQVADSVVVVVMITDRLLLENRSV